MQIGDTITEAARPTEEPFPGFKEVKPMVFAGLYPIDGSQYEELRDAMEKLRLNDASFFFEPETSTALGFGFRCGFLGLLHMEIIQERLEREFNLDLITTAPGVRYRVTTTDGEVPRSTVAGENARHRPDHEDRRAVHRGDDPDTRRTRRRHTAALSRRSAACRRSLNTSRRTACSSLRVAVQRDRAGFLRPLKTVSRGYASLDYHLSGYWESQLVKLDVLVTGEPVDALSLILHTDTAYTRAARWPRR